MTFLRSLLLVCPAACLLAQAPPPKPAAPEASTPPANATPVPPPLKIQMAPPAVPKVASVPPDRVVLKIGDVSLTFAQFEELIAALPPQAQMQARGPGRKQFADYVVKMYVLADEAKRRKLDETPVFKTQRMLTEKNLLANAEVQEVGKEAKVSDEEARKYYDAHKADFEEITARHILIRMQGASVPLRPGQKELSDAEALAKAKELRQKIADGADFAKIAETESDDVSSGAKGGVVGPFRHGQMVPSFEQAAYAMKPGDLSEPVKSQFGYHIIKVESRDSRPFEVVKGEITTRLQPQATQQAIDDLVKKAGSFYDPEFFDLPKQ